MIIKNVKEGTVEFTAETDFDKELLTWYRDFPVLGTTQQREILTSKEKQVPRHS